MGHAAAMATVLFFAVLVLTVLIFRTTRSWVYYEGESR
jgi:multiple sugar transport system permease protein